MYNDIIAEVTLIWLSGCHDLLPWRSNNDKEDKKIGEKATQSKTMTKYNEIKATLRLLSFDWRGSGWRNVVDEDEEGYTYILYIFVWDYYIIYEIVYSYTHISILYLWNIYNSFSCLSKSKILLFDVFILMYYVICHVLFHSLLEKNVLSCLER